MDLVLQKTLFGTNGDEISNMMKKLNISQRMLDESLNQLENWFKLQPHLPDISRDDPHVIKTLFVASFSVEKTKRKLENLYTGRSIIPELYANRDPLSKEFERVEKCFKMSILPKISKDNYRITVLRLVNDDVDLFDLFEIHKLGFMNMDMRFHYDTNFNDVYIVNFSNFRLGHLTKINPIIIKNNLLVTQKCYICKIVSIHVVNIPQYAVNTLNFLKSLLKKKIADRFHVHDNLESLYKHVSREDLPFELGGDAGNCDEISGKICEAFKTDLWRNRLNEMSNMKSDESKRPKNSKSEFGEEFGISGSFRKIDID